MPATHYCGSPTIIWGYSPDRIIEADKNAHRKSYVSIVTSIKPQHIRSFKTGKNEKESEFETGRFLYVEIDPTGPSKQIKADFIKLLDRYMKKSKGNRERAEKRIGQMYHDPFKTYDLHHDERMNIDQITEKGFSKTDEGFSAAYHRQWRALEKAKKMINAVTPTQYPRPFPDN